MPFLDVVESAESIEKILESEYSTTDQIEVRCENSFANSRPQSFESRSPLYNMVQPTAKS